MKNKDAGYVSFTKQMRQDYTVFIPNMLVNHFKLISEVFTKSGMKTVLLETTGDKIKETGLKYTHNDACYPAIVVIGQFIDAIENGGYDPHKVALMMFQTGGGCRASNYISLIRKALLRAGYGYVPVISLSFMGIERHSGFKLTLPLLNKLLYAVLFGDLLYTLVNQTKPYEVIKGSAQKEAEELTDMLSRELVTGVMTYGRAKKLMENAVESFLKIERCGKDKIRVGVVGEIFVKFSPLANNSLEDYIVSQGAEVVCPGLLDFFLYCLYNNLTDRRFYGKKKLIYPFVLLGYKIALGVQKDMNDILKKSERFRPGCEFDRTVTLTKGYISHGCKMGEGWLLTAEMLELIDSGTQNIICTQPFGCLPNHIAGKGMMNLIKRRKPQANIIAIDFDAGASEINQQNRIKLMLENATEIKKTGEEK